MSVAKVLKTPTQAFRQSLQGWVFRLVDQFPGFDEDDLVEMVKEKTGLSGVREEFEAIRVWYLRAKLEAWVSQDRGSLGAAR